MAKVYEVGGKLYEALIAIILKRQEINYKWEETLPGVGVVSDFVLHEDDSPYMVLLVTHSNAESGTHMKFWRNVDELFDLKSFNPHLIVCNVTFFSNWKPELSKIEKDIFDADFTLSDKAYAPLLNDVIDVYLPVVVGKSKKDTVAFLEEKLKNDDVFRKYFLLFEADFVKNVLGAKENPDLIELWCAEQTREKQRTNFRADLADTWYKCAFIKLAFFTKQERNQIYQFIVHKKALPKQLQQKATLFAFYQASGRIGMFDAQIDGLVRKLSPETVETVIEQVENDAGDKLSGYVALARNANIIIDFVNNELPHIVSQEENLGVAYIVNMATSYYLKNKGKRNQFLDLCFTICKFLDKRFSYDVVVNEADLVKGSGPDRLAGVDRCLLGECILPQESLERVALVLYKRLNSRQDYCGLIDEIIPNAIHQNYVTLIKHRTINHLRTLIEIHLKQLGWEVEEKEIKFRSCLSDYASAPPNTGDASFTYSVKRGEKRLLIQVASAYSATHKHKEFPGKLRAVRYKCEKKPEGSISFIPNPQFTYDAVLLIMDGCWLSLFSTEDKITNAFCRSGWTQIMSIDKFVSISEFEFL